MTIKVWPDKTKVGSTLLALMQEGGLTSAEADAKKKEIVDASPGWFSHNWGKLTKDKTKVSYVASGKVDGVTYYFAAGYVDAWATYDASSTDGMVRVRVRVRAHGDLGGVRVRVRVRAMVTWVALGLGLGSGPW